MTPFPIVLSRLSAAVHVRGWQLAFRDVHACHDAAKGRRYAEHGNGERRRRRRKDTRSIYAIEKPSSGCTAIYAAAKLTMCRECGERLVFCQLIRNQLLFVSDG